jgi:hypothetical protein
MDRQVVCSQCLEIVDEPAVHVLPWFNDDMDAFVTTYRCEACWPSSLEQTRARIAATDDWTDLASAAEVLRNHGVFIAEYMRGDTVPVVRQLLLHLIGMLRDGDLRLPIGPDRPV